MSKESEESSTEYRERVIEDILRKRSGKVTFGAFSAEVCQICGEIQHLEEMAVAKAHVNINGQREHFHSKCVEGDRSKASNILKQQLHRFCELCVEQFQHTKDNCFSTGWLCPKCLTKIDPKNPQNAREFIFNIRRRRFLEAKDTDELREIHVAIEIRRFEMEADNLSSLEKLRFDRHRGYRRKELLKQLENFHLIESRHGHKTTGADANVIAKDGDIWTITFRGNSVRLGDLKGLTYIVYLLQHPNEIISATQLVGITENQTSGLYNEMSKQQIEEEGLIQVVNLGDAGEAADPKTHKEIKRRLLEIEEEKMEAERLADSEKYDELEEKTEELKRYLSRNYGQGNRPRRAGSHADRMRINVNRAIQRVVGKIRKQNEALAAYLKSTIKTGFQVSYTPDPNNPVSWTFPPS